MGWLDALEQRAREVIKPAAPPKLPAKPAVKPEIKHVFVQTSAPRDGHPGSVVVGYYSASDGMVDNARRGRKADRATPALGGRRGSPWRGVPTDPGILASEGAGLLAAAQLSTIEHCLSKGAPAATWRDDGGQQGMERGQSVTWTDVARNGLQNK
jgi:hypothetical protein